MLNFNQAHKRKTKEGIKKALLRAINSKQQRRRIYRDNSTPFMSPLYHATIKNEMNGAKENDKSKLFKN